MNPRTVYAETRIEPTEKPVGGDYRKENCGWLQRETVEVLAWQRFLPSMLQWRRQTGSLGITIAKCKVCRSCCLVVLLIGCANHGDVAAILTDYYRSDASVASSQNSDKWKPTDIGTVRLAPEAFSSLSAEIVADLNARGCTIPQPWGSVEPENVLHGRFTDAEQMDVAVLCSINGISSIRVYRGGTTTDVAVLNRVIEDTYLQDVGGGGYGFSRAVYIAEPSHIRQSHAAFGGPQLPPLDHDGLGDAFLEKASVIWYWYDSKWLQLTGSD